MTCSLCGEECTWVKRRNLYFYYELQVYADESISDGSGYDVWQIRLEDYSHEKTVAVVHARVRFFNNKTNCALQSSRKQLPSWGFGQFEVSCDPSLRSLDNPRAVFNVESIEDANQKHASLQVRYGFWERFAESHKVMREGNSGFQPL